jgi:16S rRNA (cytosine1402-N4)-methyltransferase
MRMDRSAGPTAAQWLARVAEAELARVLFTYGEERYAKRIAAAIVGERRRRMIETTRALAQVVRDAVPAHYRHGRIHCATRTFQAIRIAVNGELESLEPALRQAAEILIPGGRLCVIAFHSLEDRIVKQTFRALSGGPEPVLRLVTKKPMTPSDTECHANRRARSAKLRIAERVAAGRCA